MNYDEIKKLMEDMGESKIDFLEIEFPEGIKIKMKKGSNPIQENSVAHPVMQQISVNTSGETILQEQPKEECSIITSPMVGTFYESPSPGEKPFVKVGDKIKKGDIVGSIEAMKLMNEIESEYEGEIVEICVKNETMVEYGTPLFKIK